MPLNLVIGASRGLGLEFVQQLLIDGQDVIATARTTPDLNTLDALGADAHLLDVEDEASIEKFLAGLDEESIDLVVHNAGVFGTREGTKDAPSRDVFDKVMRTNVFGAMRLIPGLAPKVENAQGRYVFVSSDMASLADVQSSHGALYRTSKAALNMLIRCAALDFPQASFLALSPGWVRTDMGGEDAPLSAQESVHGMLEIISNITQEASGSFRDYAGASKTW